MDGLGVPATFKFYKDPARAVDVARNVYGKWSKAWEMVLRKKRRRALSTVGRAGPVRAALRPGTLRLHLPREIGVVYAPIQTWNAVNDQFAFCERSVAQQYFSCSPVFWTPVLLMDYRGGTATIEHGMAPTCLNPSDVLAGKSERRSRRVAAGNVSVEASCPRLENGTLRRTTIPAVIARDDGLSRCTELMPYVLLTTLLDIVALEFGASRRRGGLLEC